MIQTVTELAAGDIQRGGGAAGVSAGGEAALQVDTAPPAAEPMGEAQAAAVSHLGELRKQAADPALSRDARDVLLGKMAELARHTFLGERAPAWYGEQKADPRDTSNEPYDPMANVTQALSEPMTQADLSQLRTAGTVKGLLPEVAGKAVELMESLGMPRLLADQFLDSVVRHAGATHGDPALTAAEMFAPLNDAEAADFYALASKLCGGSDKLDALRSEVSELLKERGLLAGLDRIGFTKTGLWFDPRVLNTLRLWLQTPPRA